MAQVDIKPSLASVGDFYDNALAETIIVLYKAEVVELRAFWKPFDAVEFSVAGWVAWFKANRLLGPIVDIPRVETEVAYCKSLEEPAMAA